MAPVNSELTPQARELVELFSLRVQAQIQQLAKELRQEVHGVRDGLERRMDTVRGELSGDLSEIKAEQREQRRIVEEQGKAVAKIETRLDDGERRFQSLESRMARQEEQSALTGKGIAYLAGAAAAGGAVTGTVLKLLN